eukprot:TRINITY_DN5716_c0_g1_i1.p1 TRINITY_DN5716_c0_g1~~TRINITY_DN5716_c0_g1_i1.p1  ORF type:complete len:145 (-),score=43.42 TRINITY_DN5716_c0_g1_i1:35-469(-)
MNTRDMSVVVPTQGTDICKAIKLDQEKPPLTQAPAQTPSTQEQVSKLWEDTKNTVEQKTENAKELLQQKAGETKRFLEEKSEKAKEFLNQKAKEVEEGVGKAVDVIETKANNAKDVVASAVAGLVEIAQNKTGFGETEIPRSKL